MGKYMFIIVGLGLLIASFIIAREISTPAGISMVWALRIVGLSFALSPFLLRMILGYGRRKKQENKEFLLKNGIEATATLLTVNRTGVFLNEIPQFVFKVNVSTVNHKEFTTVSKKYVRLEDLSKIKEGMQIPAYIHPQNQDKILLLWEKIGIGEAF